MDLINKLLMDNENKIDKLDNELRAWLRFYASDITNDYETIKAFDKFNINNYELDEEYESLARDIENAYIKIVEYRNKLENL